jgi:signal transduction histidine kinase
MSNLIDDLVELTQLDAGHLDLNYVLFDLGDLISDTLESFAARAEALAVNLEGQVGDQVELVRADPEKLSRILDNLLSNALRHTPAGGKILLIAEQRKAAAVVRVEDSGSGIEPEHLSRIFDPFYRGDSSRARDEAGQGGVGLGLAIAKGLIEAHGGSIRVDSRPEEGTTFEFSIPDRAGTLAEE